MPTLREVKERTTQQVRSLASHSINYVQEKISAFNDFIAGKNRNNVNQSWSTTTSERNLAGCTSSKKICNRNSRSVNQGTYSFMGDH